MPKRTLHKVLAHEIFVAPTPTKIEKNSRQRLSQEAGGKHAQKAVEVLEREGTCILFSFVSTAFTFTFFLQFYNLKDTQY
jgi:hypothetical protein